jgi:hypothetical protein
MIRFQSLACVALVAMLVVTVRPAEARFVSVDPVKADANTGENFNRYHYGNNNPYRYTDPDGRQSRELNFESAQSGHQPPPRHPDDYLGNPARNTHQSHIPKVRAYLGSLPADAHGFEFTTPIAPDIGHVPWKPTWSPGTPGVVERNGQAVIPCTVTTSSC